MESFEFVKNEVILEVNCPIEVIHSLIEEMTETEYFVFILIKHCLNNGITISIKNISDFYKIDKDYVKHIIKKLYSKYGLLELRTYDDTQKHVGINESKLNYYKNKDNDQYDLFKNQKKIIKEYPNFDFDEHTSPESIMKMLNEVYLSRDNKFEKKDRRKREIDYTTFDHKYCFPILSTLFPKKLSLREYLVLAFVMERQFYFPCPNDYLVHRDFNNYSASKFFHVAKRTISGIFTKLSNKVNEPSKSKISFFGHTYNKNELSHSFNFTFDNLLYLIKILISETRRQNQIFHNSNSKILLTEEVYLALIAENYSFSINERIIIEDHLGNSSIIESNQNETKDLTSEEITDYDENIVVNQNIEDDSEIDIKFLTSLNYEDLKDEDFEEDPF